MNDNEYMDNLQIIYNFLFCALVGDRRHVKDGYIEEAMSVVEAIFKKKGNLYVKYKRPRKQRRLL